MSNSSAAICAFVFSARALAATGNVVLPNSRLQMVDSARPVLDEASAKAVRNASDRWIMRLRLKAFLHFRKEIICVELQPKLISHSDQRQDKILRNAPSGAAARARSLPLGHSDAVIPEPLGDLLRPPEGCDDLVCWVQHSQVVAMIATNIKGTCSDLSNSLFRRLFTRCRSCYRGESVG